MNNQSLSFEKKTVTARFIAPSSELVEKHIEVRTNPISGRTSRIAFGRGRGKRAWNGSLTSASTACR